MEITRRADYAVRTMVDIASQEEGSMALTSEVAARQGIPAPFLAKIVLALTQANLLRSYRGAGGGLALAQPASQVNLLQIVEAIDGPVSLNRCVLWPEECSRSGACPVHEVWCEAHRLLADHLRRTSLADLVLRSKAPRVQDAVAAQTPSGSL